MTPKFSREEILYDEQNIGVNYQLDVIILEFAVLGYLDIARRLVSLRNKYNPGDNSQSAVLKPLWLAWAETNNWPDGERDNSQESAEELAESYSKSLASQNDADSSSSDEEKVRQILEKIDSMDPNYSDATTGASAMGKSEALVQVLDTILKLDENDEKDGDDPVPKKKRKVETRSDDQDKIPSVEEILDIISKRLHCNQQINYLAKSARAWKILKNKALSKAVGVQDDKVLKLAEEVEETFKERFDSGRKTGKDFTMAELVETCAENSRTNEGAKTHWLEVGDDPPETYTRSPASLEEIAELEKRLDVTLPEDFKEFLRITNGIDQTWGGIIMDPPLYSTQDIRWISEDEDYFTDLELDLLEGEIWSIAKDVPEITDDWPKVGRPIEIGTEDIDNVWLLPPATVDTVRKAYLKIVDSETASEATRKRVLDNINTFAGSREKFEQLDWCVLTWASGGAVIMNGYPSFRGYMSSKAKDSGTDKYPSGGSHERECFAYSCL